MVNLSFLPQFSYRLETSPRFAKAQEQETINSTAIPQSSWRKRLKNPNSELRLRWAFSNDQASNTGLVLKNNPAESKRILSRLKHLPPSVRVKIANAVGHFTFRDSQQILLPSLLTDNHPLVFDTALESLGRFRWPSAKTTTAHDLAQFHKLPTDSRGETKRPMAVFYKAHVPADKDYMTLLETAAQNPQLTDGSLHANHQRAVLVSQALKLHTTQLHHNPADGIELRNSYRTQEEITELLTRQVDLVTQLPYIDAKTLAENQPKPKFLAVLNTKPLKSPLAENDVVRNGTPYTEQLAHLQQQVEASPLAQDDKTTLMAKLEAAKKPSSHKLGFLLA